jgi:hypothetical protein
MAKMPYTLAFLNVNQFRAKTTKIKNLKKSKAKQAHHSASRLA